MLKEWNTMHSFVSGKFDKIKKMRLMHYESTCQMHHL